MTKQHDLTKYDRNAAPTDQRTIIVSHVSEDTDLYGGRANRGRCMGETDPPRSGWLGNPHRVADHGREEAIEKFREDFVEQLRTDWGFANACVSLPGQSVACHCRQSNEDEPDCHLDVVRSLLLDGTVFAAAYYDHDISMADWKEQLAKERGEL
jgi:hypothetical protein